MASIDMLLQRPLSNQQHGGRFQSSRPMHRHFVRALEAIAVSVKHSTGKYQRLFVARHYIRT